MLIDDIPRRPEYESILQLPLLGKSVRIRRDHDHRKCKVAPERFGAWGVLPDSYYEMKAGTRVKAPSTVAEIAKMNAYTSQIASVVRSFVPEEYEES